MCCACLKFTHNGNWVLQDPGWAVCFACLQRWGAAPLGGSTFLGVNLISFVKALMREAAVSSGLSDAWCGFLGDPRATSLHSKEIFNSSFVDFSFILFLKCHSLFTFQIWQHTPVLHFKSKASNSLFSKDFFKTCFFSGMFCFLYNCFWHKSMKLNSPNQIISWATMKATVWDCLSKPLLVPRQVLLQWTTWSW